MQILGIDVGGTAIKAALIETSTGALLSERVHIGTPKPATPEAIGQTLRTLVEKRFAYNGPIGIGFPAAIQHGIARTAAGQRLFTVQLVQRGRDQRRMASPSGEGRIEDGLAPGGEIFQKDPNRRRPDPRDIHRQNEEGLYAGRQG